MKRTSCTILLGIILTSCGASPENTASLHGNVIHPSKAWTSPVINVCWENGTAQHADFKKKVEHAIVGSYNLFTNVKFVGWGPCVASGGLNIEIFNGGKTSYKRPVRVDDGHPRVFGFGQDLDGKRPGLLLNPSLKKVNKGLAKAIKNYSKAQLENLQFSIALHEFGHVVGLVHEQDRADSACKDYIDSNLGAGNPVGPDDPSSIMNYCLTHVDTFQNPLFLSDGDIEAINTLYP